MDKSKFDTLRKKLKEHLSQLHKDFSELEKSMTDEEYDNEHLKDYHKFSNGSIDMLEKTEQEILQILLNWNYNFTE